MRRMRRSVPGLASRSRSQGRWPRPAMKVYVILVRSDCSHDAMLSAELLS